MHIYTIEHLLRNNLGHVLQAELVMKRSLQNQSFMQKDPTEV